MIGNVMRAKKNVYKFSVKDGNEHTVKLKDYKGKVLLIVNTAPKITKTANKIKADENEEKTYIVVLKEDSKADFSSLKTAEGKKAIFQSNVRLTWY